MVLAERRARQGISIIELLIAMTISLVVLYAMMWQFNVRVGQVAEARASVELLGQLRGTTRTLQHDLRRHTADARPWATSSSGAGYIELIEGPGFDFESLTNANPNDDFFGDFDDVVALTVRSEGSPFVGFLWNPSSNPPRQAIDSHYAEVVWWTVWSDANADAVPQASEIALYRRQLLIRPDLGTVFSYSGPATNLAAAWAALKTFYDNSDVSTHPVVSASGGNISIQLVANSLADLVRRENRFCHHPILRLDNSSGSYSSWTPSFPYEMVRGRMGSVDFLPALNTVVKMDDPGGAYFRSGEDVIQGNVLAFDVKVYDPEAPIVLSVSGREAISPNDPGFQAFANNPSPVSYGDYVDMFFMRPFGVAYPLAAFAGPPAIPLRRIPSPNWSVPLYDTWCFDYEQDGVDQDGDGKVDEGTNGIDDIDDINGVVQLGVDDPGERETQPPYNVPLRGVKISIRVMEPSSRTVRQMSVIQDFVPF